jgi:peptidoglycan/xylan/chitin deacetylase (PgdA/CDA1 family)
VRAVARRALERALLPLAPVARRRRARRGDAAILSYHNVTPDGAAPAGDTSLHLPLRSFVDQIERLRRTHRVVPLDDLVQGRCAPGHLPLAAITFDDAYRGALALGIPALVERGLPATIFVAPGLLGAASFWWDALASPGGIGLDPRVRTRVLGVERGRQPAATGRAPHLRSDQGPADAGTVARAAALPGVSLASHTWSHPNLTALPPDELAAEMASSRAWLRAEFPSLPGADHLSFPYGLWDRRVADAARAAGYRFLYRVEGGVASLADPESSALARINVPAGVSGAGFELRAAGLIGSGGVAAR